MKLEAWVGVKVGDRVVADAGKAETPLSGRGRGGGVRHYLKAAALLIDDGTVAYGCLWDGCDYTSDNATSIVTGHWKVHEVKPDLRRVPYGDWTLVEILGRLTDVEADLDRALAARDKAVEAHHGSREVIAGLRADVKRLEGELATIRSTFKSLSGM
jgi:hypothetical protein